MKHVSEEFKRRENIREGAKIADALPKLRKLRDVARQLGISDTAVRTIECLALYKIKVALEGEL